VSSDVRRLSGHLEKQGTDLKHRSSQRKPTKSIAMPSTRTEQNCFRYPHPAFRAPLNTMRLAPRAVPLSSIQDRSLLPALNAMPHALCAVRLSLSATPCARLSCFLESPYELSAVSCCPPFPSFVASRFKLEFHNFMSPSASILNPWTDNVTCQDLTPLLHT
jgi:hypothetical protein